MKHTSSKKLLHIKKNRSLVTLEINKFISKHMLIFERFRNMSESEMKQYFKNILMKRRDKIND